MASFRRKADSKRRRQARASLAAVGGRGGERTKRTLLLGNTMPLRLGQVNVLRPPQWVIALNFYGKRAAGSLKRNRVYFGFCLFALFNHVTLNQTADGLLCTQFYLYKSVLQTQPDMQNKRSRNGSTCRWFDI